LLSRGRAAFDLLLNARAARDPVLLRDPAPRPATGRVTADPLSPPPPRPHL